MYRIPMILVWLAVVCLTTGTAEAQEWSVKVNFQTQGAAVPPGYLSDYGLVFGDRGDGWSYGWDRNITADGRERNSHPDKRWDTLLHLQKGAAVTWEIALENGEYEVHLVGGDPGYTDQTNNFDIEGVVVADPTGVVTPNFDEYTVKVTVTDGRLTIKPGPGAANSKICFVDITRLAPPTKARQPNPENAVTDVPKDAVLGWTAGDFAQRHNVYVGTSFEDVNNASVTQPRDALVSEGQTGTTYTPAAPLEYGQTYYWRVDEVNAPPSSTVFKGDVWSFTVEPYGYPVTPVAATASSAQADMGPEKTIDGSGLNAADEHSTEAKHMWLSAGVQPNWIQYEFDNVYKLYDLKVWNSNQMIEPFLGFGAKSVTIEASTDGTTWTAVADVPEFAQSPGLPTYAGNAAIRLGGIEARYVRLTINTNWGGVAPQTGLAEVRFSYIPMQAFGPQPANAATGVSVEAGLSWRPGREATSHQVFLGTDQAAVAGPTAAAKTVTDPRYDPDPLDLGTTYYWKVDEVGAVTYPGEVWSFTTQQYLVVDDFESYTDKAGAEVFTAWVDGFDNPAQNGAIVGLDTAANGTFCDTTIFRRGRASMPFRYDNTQAPVSEATLTLAPARDWTAHGIKSLSLWFQGTAGNGGQLYVKINNTKVPYAGNAGDIAKPGWMLWSIDLSTVAAGVSKVTKLTLGVEGAGAKGTLHVDDVQLSPTVLVPITQPVITAVVRANGQAGSRTDASPVTAYTGGTAPAAMPLYGLMDGVFVFSDRTFQWFNTPAELVGAEYVLTFNNDKNAGTTDVTYTVTLSRPATVFITCDDRFADQQATVDQVVAAFAKPGQFQNTGLKLYIQENATTNRPVSVFAADLAAGTYVFGSQIGNNCYVIGVLPK